MDTKDARTLAKVPFHNKAMTWAQVVELAVAVEDLAAEWDRLTDALTAMEIRAVAAEQALEVELKKTPRFFDGPLNSGE